MEREEVDPNRDEDADVKCDPKPNTGCHSARLSCPAAHGNSESIREQVANCDGFIRLVQPVAYLAAR